MTGTETGTEWNFTPPILFFFVVIYIPFLFYFYCVFIPILFLFVDFYGKIL